MGVPGAAAAITNMSQEPVDEALTAFASANWRFISPSPETRQALASGQDVGGAEDVGKVVLRPGSSVAVVTKRLNVQLRENLSEQECNAILVEKNLEVLTKLNFAPNLYEVIAHGREDALAASVELHEDERFTLAEPSFIEHIPGRFRPSDPRYAEQWQWRNTGQSGGTDGADVRAEAAWDITRGAGIRVAVIDNGFDAGHEDLAAGISAMSAFYRATPGAAATFVQGTAGMPDSSHGTFCAGMAGARCNNERGGSGAAPECELMLIAALGDQVGTQTTLARAVAYAANPANEGVTGNGADILVSSLGPNGAVWDLTVVLQLALEAAGTTGRNGRGLAIFWAASNGNNVDVTLDEVVSHPDVAAVVRSDHHDREDNAARGATVDLIAPGVIVVSTFPGNGYGPSTGTSFAAPCAAGCAALALSVNPGLTRNALLDIMFSSADKIGGVVYDANGHNDDYGFGRVNAHQAVLRASNSAGVPGQLLSYGDAGTPGNVSSPVVVGFGGWLDFKFLFAGRNIAGEDRIYAVNQNGELLSYGDAGTPGNVSSPVVVGFGGWLDFKFLFAGRNIAGEDRIYAVNQNGELLSYGDAGTPGNVSSPVVVGFGGWLDFKFLFAGRNIAGEDRIYAVNQNGELLSYGDAGTPGNVSSPVVVGFGGWLDFKFLFAGRNIAGEDRIYAVNQNGELLSYGDAGTPGNVSSPVVVGFGGWLGFKFLFAGRNIAGEDRIYAVVA